MLVTTKEGAHFKIVCNTSVRQTNMGSFFELVTLIYLQENPIDVSQAGWENACLLVQQVRF